MKAIHVNWTAPFFHRERLRGHGFRTTREIQSDTYDIPDYQILYTILSALRWKTHNGPIKLYTDTIGISFYKQLRVLDLYDEVDIDFLNNLPSVDPALFWTSGKIQSLANEQAPFIFLDQDFIIRDKVPESLYKGDIGIGHWEIPRGHYYFTEDQWQRDINHMSFPENYNINAYSPNTSFLYFSNNKVVEEYVEWHKKMITSSGDEIPEWFWLATDQGILGHVIREGKYNTTTLTDKIFLADNDYGNLLTRKHGYSEQWYYPMSFDRTKNTLDWEHVWLAKIVYGLNPELLESDTQRFFNEIVDLGGEEYLTHFRFAKYFNKYEEQDSSN
jgi:hypothetical protein